MSAPTLPAYVPLAFLEAMRSMDTPVEDGFEEIAGEVVAKRFGLSETVAAQIERYQEQMESGDAVPRDDVIGVIRLAGRRADAALVFADAGRRAARHAIRRDAGGGKAFARLPGALGRAAGARAAAKLAAKAFELTLEPSDTAPTASVDDSLVLAATGGDATCVFYGAAMGELLRGLIGFEGAMFHDRCRARGDARCEWRGAAAAMEE